MNETIKLMLADDHSVIRSGLKQILITEPDIQVVGEARTGQEAIEKALELKPDILMMDIMMPEHSGLEALTTLREKLPELKVLFFTVSEQEEDLIKAIRSGAQGYLLKSASVDEVIGAVRKVAAGEMILSPAMASLLMTEFHKKPDSSIKLSAREKEVLELTGQGLTNRAIAEKLYISDSTVKTHLQRLMEKLGLKNRAEVIAHYHSRSANNPY